MKSLKKYIYISLFLPLFMSQTLAQDNEAPYFLVENLKPGSMPLLANKAEVYVSGIIADVTLTQTYQNNSDSIIEAIYVFPGSSQSAVYDMEMQIGSRIIKAELKEKEDARKTYEKAKKEGRRTSLLEQHRPNVFQMNVANILPGEQIQVRLRYTEKIIPEHGRYQFVLPTVVGPRFHQNNPENPASFVHMPYGKAGIKPQYTYEIDVFIQSGHAIQEISSSSHLIHSKKFNAKMAHVTLDNEEIYAGNKDFILNYRLADYSINSGLMLYKGEEENFFMASIQPPLMIVEENIPAKEYIFIVDISGSMFGFPLEVSKKLMKDLLNTLKPTDKFNVLLFAGTSYMFSDTSMFAVESNINEVVNNLENREGGGGTMLLPALEKGINFPRSKEGLSRSIVVVTDGYISVEKETFELVRNNLHKANVFAFGIGSSTNRFLIEGLANVGNGLPFIVEKEETACDVSERFKEYISTPSLSNITISYEGFDAYEVEPRTIPDLLGERPINIIGKWRGETTGSITIDGYYAGSKYSQKIELDHYAPHDKNAALRMLWAREKLRLMDDYRKITYDESFKQEMIDHSLKYNLLSAYTSFVAVDYEKVNATGQLKQVKQALPMPEGVSNFAVGAEMTIKKSSKVTNTRYLKIKEIKGLNDPDQQESVRKAFVMNIRDLKKCLSDFPDNQLEITLKFDEEGFLDGIDFNIELDKTIQKELIKLITSWNLSAYSIDPKTDITVSITF